MFRRLLLPRACLGLALGLLVIAGPVPGWSQDRSTQERLDRLERDLNMLQRQVYGGAPPPAVAGDSAAVDAEVRMERLEQHMRDLTGRLEELSNQVGQVRRQVAQIAGGAPVQVGQTGGGSGAPAAAPPLPPEPAHAALPFPPPPPGNEALTPPGSEAGSVPGSAAGPDAGSLTPPVAEGPPPGGSAGGPTPIFGTLQPPGVRSANPQRGNPHLANPELASTAAAPRPAAAGTLPSGPPGAQYKYAFGLLKKADYPAAAVALKTFVARHPKEALAGDAQYWLGETYYARRRYMEAASAFAEGYKRYPKSAKAPDDLLKLGMSLARADQKRNACVALRQLAHDFPHAAAPVRERAAAEKRRLGC